MRHKVRRVHFVGVGGAGMSGIAEVIVNLGFEVSGSDLVDSPATRHLSTLGACVYLGHSQEHITDADVVVVSTAVDESNPEIVAARAAHIPVVPRAQMLAEIMRFRRGIAVAGTHGKTTTTSLVASILAEGGLDPTFVIGGRLNQAGANARLGAGELLVAEADESDASFLHLNPELAVVTNIDADHMDTYGHDMGRLKQAFIDFLTHLPFYGLAILCGDDAQVRDIIPYVSRPIITYGLSEGVQVQAVDVRHEGGKMQFKVLRSLKEKQNPMEITLNLPGLHNVSNALAAICVAQEVGVCDDDIKRALAGFGGVGRRFQNYGEVNIANGAFLLVDDYGHHPVEMTATLAAVRSAFPDRRLVLAFQPHRYTRTRDLFEDFVRILSSVDALLLAEVYAAGEIPIQAADGRALSRAIRVAGKLEPIFVEQIESMPDAILQIARPGDVVLTMGAGSIGHTAAKIMEMSNG
ncbi:MAG: UDP-N-acetylmuramate--L-alanine ligase [Proteobacteria bacterium]|nr:UDP-N-acetylmuramate--L-alanine ligase [Pseudomonadota bacterium]MDE3208362.1 UDP-N-acetylmuramate--L-alanine ligase [Pseudomonadota bacterium]